MARVLCIFACSVICILENGCLTRLGSTGGELTSLCSLQKRVGRGQHRNVTVSGIYYLGLDLGVLEDDACPKEGTWVELRLKSERYEGRKRDLRDVLKRDGQALVVFEGEFYGPPLPDPKLPEAIRKRYRPGWGHLAAFRTKLVVGEILEVKAVSKE